MRHVYTRRVVMGVGAALVLLAALFAWSRG
jgi:hypothetical protein